MKATQLRNSKTTIETLLVALFFLALVYALFDVLKVFLGIFTFSLIFAISFARPFEKIVVFFKGKRTLAAIIYAFLLIAIIAQPFLFLISTLSHRGKFSETLRRLPFFCGFLFLLGGCILRVNARPPKVVMFPCSRPVFSAGRW